MTDLEPVMRRVVLTGTFDVRNYGDLLFPLIAAHKLAALGITILPASPNGRATGWDDAIAPVDLQSALFGEEKFDGVLIGGGNIIHSQPVTLPDYLRGGTAAWAYGSLWLGATTAAARKGVPVVWNAPGVPHAFGIGEQATVQEALAAASYVSVRDQASAAFLAPFRPKIVPDTALDIAQIWPKRGLQADFRALLERKRADPAARFVAIHVKSRSVVGEVDSIAPLIDAFSRKTGWTPILIGIGQCHDDHLVTGRLARALTVPSTDLSKPVGLREIAAAIAFSEGYVGASMHGYITAAAYGVPGMIVGHPRLPKMQGLLAHLSREADEATNWQAALMQMANRNGLVIPALPDQVSADLDAHWIAVAQALTSAPMPTMAQARFRTMTEQSDTDAYVPPK